MPVDQGLSELLFAAHTPLGCHVAVTRARWELIATIKHPVMVGRHADVLATLEQPLEIRQSRSDPGVFLFYRAERAGRWICAVARCAGAAGFLITAYPTDAIKEGVRVWPK